VGNHVLPTMLANAGEKSMADAKKLWLVKSRFLDCAYSPRPLANAPYSSKTMTMGLQQISQS
jgi:hypothetical protein